MYIENLIYNIIWRKIMNINKLPALFALILLMVLFTQCNQSVEEIERLGSTRK